MDEKVKLKRLDSEIFIVQMENFTNKFETQMAEEDAKTKKWLKAGFIPFGISIGVSLLTLNVLPMIIGTAYVGGIAIYKMIKDEEEYEQKLARRYNINPKVTYLEPPEGDFEFLSKPIISQKESDFLSKEMKTLMDEPRKPTLHIIKPITDSEKKEEINEPLIEEDKEHPKLPEGYGMSKEEVMIELATQYRVYKRIYELPEFKVSNKEWDILFDVMYNRLAELSLENEYYNYMSFLQRYTFAYSLVTKRKEINIGTYISQLHMFAKVGFSELDISSIEEEIRSQLNPSKVVDFNNIVLSKK